MKRLIFAGLLASVGAIPAAAADMPLKAPARLAEPAFSWSGLYLGAHVGGAWGTVESQLNDPKSDAFLPLSSHGVNGFVGGGQVGFNIQVNPWLVIGIEGDASWTDVKGTAPCLVVFACSTKVDWMATATGRLGFARDRLMVYVKGGGAWAESKHSLVLGLSPDSFSADASKTRMGWTVGTGVEYAFSGNWSAKVEYNFMDFGSDTLGSTLHSGTKSAPGPDVDINQQIHVVKFGLNYRFGGL